ncbi:MAG: phenylpyruvate tautomerase MIF-related protein [Kiritimatiellae bacterium]|nr:phenylpyruvate tautomerase MIF-related protein [Kiritimatiellia bacterium]
MPAIRIAASVQLDKAQVNAIEDDLCALVEEVLSKPRAYIMVIVHHAFVEFGNTDDPAAAVELLSIGGLNAATNPLLAKGISDILKKHANIPPERVFIVFRNVAAGDWAWNGVLFG